MKLEFYNRPLRLKDSERRVEEHGWDERIQSEDGRLFIDDLERVVRASWISSWNGFVKLVAQQSVQLASRIRSAQMIIRSSDPSQASPAFSASDAEIVSEILDISTSELQAVEYEAPFEAHTVYYLANDGMLAKLSFDDDEDRSAFYRRKARLIEEDRRWHSRLAVALERTVKRHGEYRWIQKAFGETIKEARETIGWRQNDLAKRSNYAQPIISNLETGNFDFTRVWEERLERVKRILARALFSGD